ncbi:MAG: recombination mediator RecR [Maricaulaceae bacterium]
MTPKTAGPEIERLISLLAKLPGLGPRSARRAALDMIKKKDGLMRPLLDALSQAVDRVAPCGSCGNIDTQNPCHICSAQGRDPSVICVVQDVGDLWAMERAGAFRGRYHVLGGTLSALNGIRPSDLNMGGLFSRLQTGEVKEIILAMNATVDGQTTAHYITDHIESLSEGQGVSITRLAHGVPVGGELDYLDDGTITAALNRRTPF